MLEKMNEEELCAVDGGGWLGVVGGAIVLGCGIATENPAGVVCGILDIIDAM